MLQKFLFPIGSVGSGKTHVEQCSLRAGVWYRETCRIMTSECRNTELIGSDAHGCVHERVTYIVLLS